MFSLYCSYHKIYVKANKKPVDCGGSVDCIGGLVSITSLYREVKYRPRIPGRSAKRHRKRIQGSDSEKRWACEACGDCDCQTITNIVKVGNSSKLWRCLSK